MAVRVWKAVDQTERWHPRGFNNASLDFSRADIINAGEGRTESHGRVEGRRGAVVGAACRDAEPGLPLEIWTGLIRNRTCPRL